jgi:hypothetical protein
MSSLFPPVPPPSPVGPPKLYLQKDIVTRVIVDPRYLQQLADVRAFLANQSVPYVVNSAPSWVPA